MEGSTGFRGKKKLVQELILTGRQRPDWEGPCEPRQKGTPPPKKQSGEKISEVIGERGADWIFAIAEIMLILFRRNNGIEGLSKRAFIFKRDTEISDEIQMK